MEITESKKLFRRYDYANQTVKMIEGVPPIEEIIFAADGVFTDSEGNIYSQDGYVICPPDLKYLIGEIGISPEMFAVVKHDVWEWNQQQELNLK